MTNKIRFDRDDVSLELLPTENCCDCDEAPATHYIKIVFRSAGEESSLGNGKYCLECGTEVVRRIHESVPGPLNEDGTF